MPVEHHETKRNADAASPITTSQLFFPHESTQKTEHENN